MTGAERADFENLRSDVMSELRSLRDEIRELRGELQQVRRELDTLQGGISIIKWLGPIGLMAGAYGIAKAVGLL